MYSSHSLTDSTPMPEAKVAVGVVLLNQDDRLGTIKLSRL